MIYLRQISKDQIEISTESEEYKWLKSILPFDYLNQVLEKGLACLTETSHQLNHSSLSANNSSPSISKKGNKNFFSSEPVNGYRNDEAQVITNLLKETNLELFDGYKVIIVNINDKDSECPGMRVEEKVLNDCESLASSVTSASAVSLFLNSHSNQEKSHGLRDQRHNRKGNKQNSDFTQKESKSASKKVGLVDNLDSSYEPLAIEGSAMLNGANSLKMATDTTSSIDRDDVRSRHEGSVGKCLIILFT